MPPTNTAERTRAAAITDECAACQGKGWADVTFVCAVHYADAVVWDQKRRFIKHMLNLWRRGWKERENGGRQREIEGREAAEKWP